MQDKRGKIDALRDRLADGRRDVTEPDAEALLAFSDRLDLLATEYTDYRHEKILRHCVIMAEHVEGLHAVPTDRDLVEDVVRWIHREYDNEETNRDYRSALRVFGKRLAEARDLEVNADGLPDSVAWVPTGTSRSYDPSPDPAEMLRWDEDVRPMIDESRNARDAAAVALQFDAGLRPGECFELTIGAISDGDHGLQVRVDGKQGERTVTLIPSVPHVNKWLDDHPASDDPDAPLWCHLGEAEQLSYTSFGKMFKVPARRAGVEKPVTPRNIRRSNASWLARQGANAALIEDRQGRERGSDAVSRYVATFGDDEESAYAAVHGLDVEDEREDIAPTTCPRCDKETPHDEPSCVWCGQALTPNAAELSDQAESDLVESIPQVDDATGEDILTIFEAVKNDPDAARAAITILENEDH